MGQKGIKRRFIGMILIALASVLGGCASRQEYGEWQERQYNSHYREPSGWGTQSVPGITHGR